MEMLVKMIIKNLNWTLELQSVIFLWFPKRRRKVKGSWGLMIRHFMLPQPPRLFSSLFASQVDSLRRACVLETSFVRSNERTNERLPFDPQVYRFFASVILSIFNEGPLHFLAMSTWLQCFHLTIYKVSEKYIEDDVLSWLAVSVSRIISNSLRNYQ